MTNIKDVLYAYDFNEDLTRSIPRKYGLNVEHIFDENKILRVQVPIDEDLTVEQQLLYKGVRYSITETKELKSSNRMDILAETIANELSDEPIESINLTAQPIATIIKEALKDSIWEVGHVEYNDQVHSILENGVSVMLILRQVSRLSGMFLSLDTINRKVSMVNKSGKDLDFIFRYKKNVQEITKTSFSPKATRIIPKGAGGLTIENVNDGKAYVEDYGWYESLGISAAEARKRFRKTYMWSDERFIYSGNLLREAQLKLREMAYPQITYETSVSYIDRDVKDGDYGYVVDDELGIKVKARIVRLVEFENSKDNTVELNYLIPKLGGLQDQENQSAHGGGGSGMVLAKNGGAFSSEAEYKPLIELTLTTFSSTNAQVGLTVVGKASEPTLLEGFFLLGGARLPFEIKHVLTEGWNTLGIPFIITQIQEGSRDLVLYLKTDAGAFSVGQYKAEIYIVAENMLGGMGSEAPKAGALEVVKFTSPIEVSENVASIIQIPLRSDVAETVQFVEFSATDKATVRLMDQYSVLRAMTSNVDPEPLSVIASSSAEGFPAYRAFDKNPVTHWKTSSGETFGVLTYDFGFDGEAMGDSYKILPSTVAARNPRSWDLEGSDDTETWYMLDQQTNVSFNGVREKEFEITTAGTYRFYRWSFTENNGDASHIAIAEIDLLYKGG